MTAAVVILSVILLILLITHISYRRQVKNTCRRIAFINEHKTNMKLLSDFDSAELNELEKEINRLIEKSRFDALSAQESERALKETISNLSHDIRTPLTSLDGYFQLLSEAETIQERERYISIIRGRIESLKNMLEELFTYTKLQNEDYEPETERINLSKLIFDTAFSFYDDFSAKGCEPEIDFCDKQLFINGNNEIIQRIVQNIIKNAVTHGTGYVGFSLKEENGNAVFTCSNSTEAPEEIEIDKVFTRFYKADAARTESSSGLGLSIAHDFTIKLGGVIKAELNGNIFKIIVSFRTV